MVIQSDYSDMMSFVLNGINKLKREVEALKERIVKLEGIKKIEAEDKPATENPDSADSALPVNNRG